MILDGDSCGLSPFFHPDSSDTLVSAPLSCFFGSHAPGPYQDHQDGFEYMQGQARYQGVRVRNTVKELIMRRRNMHSQVHQEQTDCVSTDCLEVLLGKRKAEGDSMGQIKHLRFTDETIRPPPWLSECKFYGSETFDDINILLEESECSGTASEVLYYDELNQMLPNLNEDFLQPNQKFLVPIREFPLKVQESVELKQNYPELPQETPEAVRKYLEKPQESPEAIQNYLEQPQESPEAIRNYLEQPQESPEAIRNYLEKPQESPEAIQNYLEQPQEHPEAIQNYLEQPQESLEAIRNYLEQPQETPEPIQKHLKDFQASPESMQKYLEQDQESPDPNQNCLEQNQGCAKTIGQFPEPSPHLSKEDFYSPPHQLPPHTSQCGENQMYSEIASPSNTVNQVSFFHWQVQQEEQKLMALSPLELMHKDGDGDTFLHIAVAKGRRALAYVLARKMASIGMLDAKEHNSQTALQVCVAADHHLIAKDLLSLGAEICTADSWGRTPLHVCAEKGHTQTLEVIEKHSECSGLQIDTEPLDYQGFTPLQIAVLSHNAVLQELCSSSAAPASQILALEQKRKCLRKCVNILLRLGASLETQDLKSGRTALHMASEDLNLELLRILLKQTSCCSVINAKSFSGNTALHLACARSTLGSQAQSQVQVEVVRLLLPRGADPTVRNLENEQPCQLVQPGPIGDQVRGILRGKFSFRR